MLTGKCITLLGIAIALLFIGILIFDYQFIVIGLFFIIFIFLNRPVLPVKLEILRKNPDLKVFEGDKQDMSLLISKNKESETKKTLGFDTNLIELTDKLPGYVSLSNGSNHKILHLPDNNVRKVSYKYYCPIRGNYCIGPIYFRLSDNSQLFYTDLMQLNYHQFPVHLGYKTIKRFDLQSKAFDWNFGQNLLNIQGKSSDFYSIRDYTKQDSYREINWKATAKKRKLMVNTFERETLSDCCIFLDSRDITSLGRPHDNFIEYSVRIAFGLSKTVIKNNNRLCLVTYGDVIQLVPPGLGMNHTAIVHAVLLDTQANGFLPFYAALLYAWSYLKPESTIVIFSPMDFDDTLYSSIISLQRMDMKIVLVTTSNLNFESRAINKFTLRNTLDNERRKNQISELEHWGVRVIDWDPKDNFEVILKKINTAVGLKNIR